MSAAIAEGYNVGLVSAAVEEKLAGYEAPAGCRLVFTGENENVIAEHHGGQSQYGGQGRHKHRAEPGAACRDAVWYLPGRTR